MRKINVEYSSDQILKVLLICRPFYSIYFIYQENISNVSIKQFRAYNKFIINKFIFYMIY